MISGSPAEGPWSHPSRCPVRRGVAPAVHRRHRQVELLHKPLRKILSQNERARWSRRTPPRPASALDGQSAGSSCLAMAIISTLVLLVNVYVCRCAPCYVSMLEAEMFEAFAHNIAEKKTALPKALREA